LDKLMGFHQKAMQVRTERMELIAGNLANANTPGYKARDLDFQKVMKSAQYAQQHNLVRTNEKHLQGSMQGINQVQFRIPDQPDTG
ncbi:flagellar basal body rod protein FlgB, partial [Sanguibacter sp. 26GB23]